MKLPPFAVSMFSVLLLLLPFTVIAKTPDLLRTARVVDTAAWGDPNAWSRFGGEVYWISNRDVFAFDNITRDYKAAFGLHDIEAGKEERLGAAGEFYSSTDAYPWTIKMSPDHRWLLWPTEGGFAGVRMDGSGSYKLTVEKPGGRKPVFMDRVRANFSWLSDSHHWAEFVQDNSRVTTKIVIRDVEKPAEQRILTIPPGSPIENLPSDSFGYPTSAGPGVSDRDNLLFVSDWLDPNGQRRTVVRLDLTGDSVRVISQKSIQFPAGWSFSSMAFGPQGNRIVWKLIKEGAEPAVNPEHPDEPSRFPHKKRTVSLWVSDADGAKMRELGEMDASELAGETNREILLQPDYIRWLPDGRSVSFMYKGKIYIVPAARS